MSEPEKRKAAKAYKAPRMFFGLSAAFFAFGAAILSFYAIIARHGGRLEIGRWAFDHPTLILGSLALAGAVAAFLLEIMAKSRTKQRKRFHAWALGVVSWLVVVGIMFLLVLRYPADASITYYNKATVSPTKTVATFSYSSKKPFYYHKAVDRLILVGDQKYCQPPHLFDSKHGRAPTERQLISCAHFVECRSYTDWSIGGLHYEHSWQGPDVASPEQISNAKCHQVDRKTIRKRYSNSWVHTANATGTVDTGNQATNNVQAEQETPQEILGRMVPVPQDADAENRQLTAVEKKAVKHAVQASLKIPDTAQFKWSKLHYSKSGSKAQLDNSRLPRRQLLVLQRSLGGDADLFLYCGLVKTNGAAYTGFVPFRAFLADGPKGATAIILGSGLASTSSPLSQATVAHCRKYGYFTQ